MTTTWPLVPLGRVLTERKEFIRIDDLASYKRCRVQLHTQGIVLRDSVSGAEIKTKEQQVCRGGDFLVAEIDAKVGGYGIVPDDLAGAIVSGHYFLFTVDTSVLNRRFLDYYVRTAAFFEQVKARASTNYAAIRSDDVLSYKIPLPPLSEQQRIVARIDALAARIDEAWGLRREAAEECKALVANMRSVIFSGARATFPIVRLDSAVDTRLGKMLSQASRTGVGSTPYLRNANVKWDALDLTDVSQMDFTDEEREEFLLQKDDILACEGGGISVRPRCGTTKSRAVVSRRLFTASESINRSLCLAFSCTIFSGLPNVATLRTSRRKRPSHI